MQEDNPTLDHILLNAKEIGDKTNTHLENMVEGQGKIINNLKIPKPIDIKIEVTGEGESFKIEGPKGDKGDEGEPGKTPKIGIDYFTEDDLNKIIKEVVKRIGKPEPGKTPIKGKDYDTDADRAALIKELVPFFPKGKIGPKGDQGDDAEVDYPHIIAAVLKQIPKPDKQKPQPSLDQIISKIKEDLSYNDLKDVPQYFRRPSGGGPGYLREIADVDTTGLAVGDNLIWNGQRWVASSGASGSTIHFADNEVPAGSGTAFTLAHAPNPVASLKLYRGGALQKAGDDYTISGLNITLSVSLSVGENLLAFYRY